MKNIRFFSVGQVLEIHRTRVERYGGDRGVRDMGLVESAAMTPQQQFGGEYLHGSLPEMAAAYFFHLIANHAFIDGNKRVGVATAILFLRANEHDLFVSEDEIEALAMSVAQGSADKADVTSFFVRHVRPR